MIFHTFHTSGGPVNIISPNKLKDIIHTEQIQQTTQSQYIYFKNMPVLPASFTSVQPILPNFTTQTNKINSFSDKEDFILTSLVNALGNRFLNVDSTSFECAIEDAAVDCVYNFGCPSHAILFGNNIMIMGDFTADNISFKEVTPNAGALIVYNPHKFSIFKVPSHRYTDSLVPPTYSKYNKYVQYIMIVETLKRLDLV